MQLPRYLCVHASGRYRSDTVRFYLNRFMLLVCGGLRTRRSSIKAATNQKKFASVTRDSRLVTHDTTNRARARLTFRWSKGNRCICAGNTMSAGEVATCRFYLYITWFQVHDVIRTVDSTVDAIASSVWRCWFQRWLWRGKVQLVQLVTLSAAIAMPNAGKSHEKDVLYMHALRKKKLRLIKQVYVLYLVCILSCREMATLPLW